MSVRVEVNRNGCRCDSRRNVLNENSRSLVRHFVQPLSVTYESRSNENDFLVTTMGNTGAQRKWFKFTFKARISTLKSVASKEKCLMGREGEGTPNSARYPRRQ